MNPNNPSLLNQFLPLMKLLAIRLSGQTTSAKLLVMHRGGNIGSTKLFLLKDSCERT